MLFLLTMLNIGSISEGQLKKHDIIIIQIEEQIKPVIKQDKIYPLNMKRNNPFNIRTGNKWLGDTNKPGAFETFKELDYGLRAGFKLLRNYASNYNLTTIERIIYRFAPPSENDTEGYIRTVCKLTGYERDQELDLWDKAQLINLAGAMIYVEQGIHISSLDKAYHRFFS